MYIDWQNVMFQSDMSFCAEISVHHYHKLLHFDLPIFYKVNFECYQYEVKFTKREANVFGYVVNPFEEYNSKLTKRYVWYCIL